MLEMQVGQAYTFTTILFEHGYKVGWKVRVVHNQREQNFFINYFGEVEPLVFESNHGEESDAAE